MPTLNAVEIVEAFWAEVWQPTQNPDAVDDFVSEDFIITSGGVDINGVLGTAPDQRPLAFTGTAVWAVRADGKLLHNWVERSAWEAYQSLTGDASR